MKNKTILYIYIAVLFVLTFLLASRVIKSLKTNEFDYIKIFINLALLVYIAIKVIKLGKIENDQKE